MFGLSTEDLNYIVSTLQPIPQIEQAIIFGSRAQGNYKKGSDVDIAIVGEKIDFDIVANLHNKLEEQSPMPYFFDIVDYTHLQHPKLKQHIDEIGKVIYQRLGEKSNGRAALALAKITPEEYLHFERQSETKHEYFDGEIFAMAGASRRHCKIVANLMRAIGNKLCSTNCNVYANDFRVKIKETGLYTYPDLVVTCGKEILEDQVKDTLLNPLIIIEILSPSTENYDRGKKFAHYRQIESLQNYVLVSQEMPSVELFQRQNDGRWLFSEKNGLENSIEIPAIDYLLPLVEVYDKIDFNNDLELR